MMKIGTMLKDIVDSFLKNLPRNCILLRRSLRPSDIGARFSMIPKLARAAVYA